MTHEIFTRTMLPKWGRLLQDFSKFSAEKQREFLRLFDLAITNSTSIEVKNLFIRLKKIFEKRQTV